MSRLKERGDAPKRDKQKKPAITQEGWCCRFFSLLLLLLCLHPALAFGHCAFLFLFLSSHVYPFSTLLFLFLFLFCQSSISIFFLSPLGYSLRAHWVFVFVLDDSGTFSFSPSLDFVWLLTKQQHKQQKASTTFLPYHASEQPSEQKRLKGREGKGKASCYAMEHMHLAKHMRNEEDKQT